MHSYVLVILKIVFLSLTICCLPTSIWPRIAAFVVFVISAVLAFIATVGAFLAKFMAVEPLCEGT